MVFDHAALVISSKGLLDGLFHWILELLQVFRLCPTPSAGLGKEGQKGGRTVDGGDMYGIFANIGLINHPVL